MALDFDSQQQMIYWTEWNGQYGTNSKGSIRRMHISGRDVQVSVTMTTMRMNDREGKPNEQYLYL